MYHDDALLFAFFIYAGKVEALRHIHIGLDRSDLPLATQRILGHEVELGAIKRGFSDSFNRVRIPLLDHFTQRCLGGLPLLFVAEIFFRLFRIMEREAYLEREPELPIELFDDVPDLEEFFFDLRFAAEYVSIVLRERTYARKTVQFPGLFIAVAHGRIGVPLWDFTIAPWFPGIDLRVVGAIHRLHREFVTLARLYTKKVVFEFFPMTARFVQLFFCYVRYFDFLVPARSAHLPHVVVEQVPYERATWGPQGESGSYELGESK